MKAKIENIMMAVGNGRIFTAVFEKKDGTERTMNCRMSVKKHTHGGELKFDPIQKNLLPVYDLKEKGYRFVNVDTLKEIRFGGEKYTF